MAECVVKCAFSLDAGCFEGKSSIYVELGKKVMSPSISVAVKSMMMPMLPKWIANYVPIP